MDFAILVGSCDKYKHLWDHFYYLFSKYWDNKIHVDKYIITQTLEANLPNFKTIKVVDNTFSTGVKKSLDTIKSKNILWLQDDYFFRRKITEDEMKFYYDFFVNNKAGRLGIHDDSEFYFKIPVYKNIYKFHQQSLYTISLQASLWDTDFLYRCFDKQKDETPWEFEVDGSNRLNNSIMHRIFFALTETPWYLESCRKGQLTDNFFNICKEEGLNDRIL